jgi:hypothetical protein
MTVPGGLRRGFRRELFVEEFIGVVVTIGCDRLALLAAVASGSDLQVSKATSGYIIIVECRHFNYRVVETSATSREKMRSVPGLDATIHSFFPFEFLNHAGIPVISDVFPPSHLSIFGGSNVSRLRNFMCLLFST